MSTLSPPSLRRRIFTSKFLFLLILVALFAELAEHWMAEEGGPREVIRRWGVWAPIVTVVVQGLTTFIPGAAIVISIANGTLYPLWLAALINLVAGTLGGLAMYYVWRRGDREFDIQKILQRLPDRVRRYRPDSLAYLTTLRLIPWAGGSAADFIAGAHHVPLRVELASLVVGYLPGAVIYALIGAGLVHAPW